jgi:polar amino acid transport system permease protein
LTYPAASAAGSGHDGRADRRSGRPGRGEPHFWPGFGRTVALPGGALGAPAVTYIEVFRGTSALVQLFWLYFALPLLGFDISAMTAGIVGTRPEHGGLRRRSRPRSDPKQCLAGQIEAAVALNLTPSQRLWRT